MTNLLVKSKRIAWIDEIKGLMLLIVVIEHVGLIPHYLNYPIVYWGSMAMPCYFALSGYLYSTKREFREFLARKSQSLLLPYVCLSIVLLLLDHNLYFGDTSKVVAQNLHKAFIECTSTGKGTPLWFVLTLYWMEILNYWLVKKIKSPEYVMMLIGVLFSVIAKLLYDNGTQLSFNLNSFFASYIFFAFGFCLKKRNVIENILAKLSTTKVCTLSLGMACAGGVIVGLNPNMGGVLRGTIPNYISFYAFGILSILITFLLARFFKTANWLFLFIARNGMTILGFHAYVQIYCINALRHFLWSDEHIFYAAILTSLVATILLSFVVNAFCWKMVGLQNKKTFQETLYNL